MVKHNYKYTFYKTTYSFSLYCFLLTGGGFFLFGNTSKPPQPISFLGFYYTTIELLILGNIE